MIPPSRHSSKFRRKPHPGIADLVVPRSLGRVSAKLASGKQSEKKQRCHCMCLFQMSVVRLQILKSGIIYALCRFSDHLLRLLKIVPITWREYFILSV